MLGVFCLRLASGLIGALLLLSPGQVNSRFFRVHFLIALSLVVVAAIFLRDAADSWTWIALGGGLAFAFAGTLAWSVDRSPGGQALIVLDSLCLFAALTKTALLTASERAGAWNMAGEFTSAALLGTATTAMLMGHSYLIAPAMSLTPLLRLLAALFVSLAARGLVSGVGFWTSGLPLSKLDYVTLTLFMRWGTGIALPLILGIMAWQTARIRSTQSATGILYVVVIFCFIGELVSQVLYQWTNGSVF